MPNRKYWVNGIDYEYTTELDQGEGFYHILYTCPLCGALVMDLLNPDSLDRHSAFHERISDDGSKSFNSKDA